MHFSRWTLRSRLIGLTVVLVAVTSIVIGGVLAFFTRQTLSDNFSSQLTNNAQSVARSAPYQDVPLSRLVEAGSVVALYQVGGSEDGFTISATNVPRQLSADDLEAVRTAAKVAAAADDPRAREPLDGEYGGRTFRFVNITVGGPGSGAVLTVGRPLSVLNGEIAAALAPIATVVILVILLAGLLGAWIIGRALRPLRRVAGVASNVASLPLERGDVEVPQRVPERDTNPHTEVGQVGSALNNLLDTVSNALGARQASEDKLRNFVADASHELRTPLASIRGYAELTRRFGGDLTEGVQHNIGRIESEAQRMTSLVEDLLLLARLDAERELDTTEVDLSRLLVDVVSDAHAAGRDHEWDLDLPEEPVIVRGDPAKLQQVFTNLLANARVHTPAGTRVTVELSAPRDGHVLARVKDDGPGIPEQLRPQLFGRFVRGDSSRARTTGSTGLGLSIVDAVVQAHHGTVSVASEPGLTVFTVQLPVEQPTPVLRSQPA